MSRATVVVAGAGPTGLALTCGLVASGVAVRVFDRATGPADTSRAMALQPRGAEVLDRLGALGDLARRSIGVRRVDVHVERRPVATLRIGDPRISSMPGLLVSQAEVEAALRRRLTELGASVRWGTAVTGVEQDGTAVRVGLGDGTTVHADWLVGCDGAHSQVRRVAGIAFPGVARAEGFLLADAQANLPLRRDGVSVWLSSTGIFGAFPLPGEDVWRLMAPVPPGTTDDDPVLDLLADLLEERTGFTAARVQDALWTSRFGFHRRLAETYRRGRVLLAGDAAHVHSPLGGQGMNTGLGDAENLAWKLALVCGGQVDPALLDSYETERRPVATDVLASTSSATRLVLGESGPTRLVRDRVAVPLMNRAFVQRMIWAQASQLRVSYRGGPLGVSGTRPRLGWGPRPGDRVPDLACLRDDGTITRLHAELGTRWVLLTPDPSDGGTAVATRHLGPGAVSGLIPCTRQAADLMLVRPDAHLGWRGSAPDELDRWLTNVLRT